MIKFFNNKQSITHITDHNLKNLIGCLDFFKEWREEAIDKHFLSTKLWFDLQSMIYGFQAIVNIKLKEYPNAVIKPWIINQDVIENHFCQVRACNGQNNNPTYKLQESTQNSIRYGQTTVSSKSNAGLLNRKN